MLIGQHYGIKATVVLPITEKEATQIDAQKLDSIVGLRGTVNG